MNDDIHGKGGRGEGNDDSTRPLINPVMLLLLLLTLAGISFFYTKNKNTGTGNSSPGKDSSLGSGQAGESRFGNSSNNSTKASGGFDGDGGSPKNGSSLGSETVNKEEVVTVNNSSGSSGKGNIPEDNWTVPNDNSTSKTNSNDPADTSKGYFTVDERVIWEKAADFIKRRAIFPDKLIIPELGIKGTAIKKADDSTFFVNGYFDAPNIKGEIRRSTFKCIVKFSQYGFFVVQNEYTID